MKMMNEKQKIKIIISKQALERFAKDKFLKKSRDWYEGQIYLLFNSQLNRPTERMGDFNITPRGHEKNCLVF